MVRWSIRVLHGILATGSWQYTMGWTCPRWTDGVAVENREMQMEMYINNTFASWPVLFKSVLIVLLMPVHKGCQGNLLLMEPFAEAEARKTILQLACRESRCTHACGTKQNPRLSALQREWNWDWDWDWDCYWEWEWKRDSGIPMAWQREVRNYGSGIHYTRDVSVFSIDGRRTSSMLIPTDCLDSNCFAAIWAWVWVGP